MEISKKLKRIISLVLVWVMFTTCIPDSFISVVRAYAEEALMKKTADVTLKFQWKNAETDAYAQDLRFYLYEKTDGGYVEASKTDADREIIYEYEETGTDAPESTKTDGTDKDGDSEENELAVQAENAGQIAIRITKNPNECTVKITGLDSDKEYAYEVKDETVGTDKKLRSVFAKLNTSENEQEIRLAEDYSSEAKVTIQAYIALPDEYKKAEEVITWNIYSVIGEGENRTPGKLLSFGKDNKVTVVKSSVKDVKIEDITEIYSEYAVEFEGENINSVFYVDSSDLNEEQYIYTLGTESEPRELDAIDLEAPVITASPTEVENGNKLLTVDNDNRIYTYANPGDGNKITRTYTITDANITQNNLSKSSFLVNGEETTVSWSKNNDNNSFSCAYDFTGEENTVKITCTDSYGNEITYTETVKIITTAPVVNISFSDSGLYSKDTGEYYYNSRTAAITLESGYAEDDLSDLKTAIIKGIKVKDYNGNDISLSYDSDKSQEETFYENYFTITDITDTKNDNKIIGFEVSFKKDCFYEMTLEYTDRSNNTCKAYKTALNEKLAFYIDKTVPEVTAKLTLRNYKGENKVYNSLYDSLGENPYYSTGLPLVESQLQPAKIMLEAKDNGSGVNAGYYYDSETIMTPNDLQKINISEWVEYTKEADITKDGNHYIYYKVVDNTGNVGYYNGLGFVMDNTAPVISMSVKDKTDKNAFWNETEDVYTSGKDVTLEVDISDANLDTKTKQVTIKKDGAKVQDTEAKIEWDGNKTTITLKAESGVTHEYEVTVECADEAGNPASLTKTIIIDKTAPTVSMTYHTEGSESSQEFTDETLLTGKDVKVGVKIEDANLYTKGITIKKDGVKDTDTEAEIKWDGNKTTITLKAESGVTHEYEVTVKCADEAGNSASLTKTIIIDKTAPEGEIGIELKKNEKASEAAKKDALVGTEGSFKLSNITDKTAGIVSNESGAYIEYKLTKSSIEQKSLENITDWDVENIKSDNSVKIKVPDKDGQYYIYFKITDKAGNYCYKDATLVIDRTAPEITMNIPEAILTKGNNELVYNDTVEVKTNISESNISSKTIKIFKNGEIWEKDTDINELSKTITLEAVKDESTKYEIVIECEDKAGNPASLTKTIIIDKTAPVLKAVFDGKEKEGAAESEKYYKEATLTITASDDKSFNLTKFQSTIEDVIKKFTAKDKNDNLITGAITVNYPKDQDGKDQAVITFGQEANYTLVESISYTDDCGNIGKLDLAKIKNEFTIDNTLPTASSFSVSTFKNGKGEESEKINKWSPEGILEASIITNPYYSYIDKNGKYASYTLGGISDNLSGIQKVEYNITSAICTDETSIGNLNEGWINATADVKDNSLNIKLEKEGTNYIYYRLTDNAGNVRYYSGVGIVIDVTDPKITYTYVKENKTDNENKTYEEKKPKISEPKTFETNVAVKIQVEEVNLENTTVKVQKDNNAEVNYDNLTWTGDGYTRTRTAYLNFASTDKGERNQYTITTNVTDKAGNQQKHEEIVIIDRKSPEITLTADNNDNKKASHYYDGERSIFVKIVEQDSLDKRAFREAIVNGISVKDITDSGITGTKQTDAEVTQAVSIVDKNNKVLYTISEWKEVDEKTGGYTVTFKADAMYTVDLSYSDLCGNTANVTAADDTRSFVIDSQAPVIEVTYNDNSENKVKDHYYKGNREATVTVKDISLLYANTVENTGKEIKVSGITETVRATDIAGNEVKSPVQTGNWELDNSTKVFSKKITFQADAIYTFEVNGTDICENTSEYKDEKSDITYKAADGTSFVIDRQAPVIEVTYNDNSENKEKDHYYKGDRKATVTVKDLSCIYENTIQNVAVGADNTGITGIGYSITAKDEKDITVSDNKSGWVSDGNWSYDSDKRQYTRDIIFTGDAIYTFEVNGTDICGNTSEYKDEKSDITYNAADGTSFVIDRQAPVVTVEYNDSSKLQDHYYSDTRTATISVKDLSYVYENQLAKQADATKTDVDTVTNRMKLALAAKDAAGNDINAMTQSGWSFADGTYRYVITYGEAAGSKVDAIFTSAFSGNDIYNNDALISYKNSEGDVTDYESFVIDREAPVVTIAYNDSSKKQEHYYSDTRTASLTVYDLSYVYENELAKQADETKTDVDTVGNRMNIMLTAKDAAGNDIDAVTESGWSFANGTYRYVITYGEAGGNKVDAIFTSAFSGNDIYTRRASISYQDSKGIVVTDYESFVIDREAPVVTIEYDDSNKLQDHYYSDTRTAAITVKDISYVYENQQAKQGKVTESDVYTVRNRMNITLTAKNAAGNDITAVTESGWNFADGAYHYVITYGEAGGNKVDAIFTSTFSGTDIYGRRTSISYQDSEEKNVEDSASFVIDRKAPVITVTYTDTGKSKDHFYNADRTAVITVDDLSYAYEDQRRTAKDVLTPQERINLEITARDSLLNALTGEKAQSESNWSFANGKYTKTITFANEAIYDFAISGSDIFAHTTLDEAVGYNTTTDNHSFVVDKTGPQVSLAYSDSNRTYYKGSRQAVLTLTDLSMIYNDRILSGTSLYLNDAQTDGTKSDSVKTTIRLRNDDAASDLNNAGNAYYTDSAWSLSGNVYTRTILYTGEAHYTFAIAGTDRCGNTADINYNGSSDAGEFWIDLTNPTAQISYDNNSQTREIGGRGYFRGLRTATIVITEGISTFDSSKVNISITAKDASGNPVEAHTTMSGWTTRQQRDTGSATTHTLTITYPGDANYDFGISYTDKAGNVMNTVDTGSSMSPYHFTVDTTSPSGSVTVSGLGTWNTLVSYRTFGLWSRTAVDIGAGYQDATSSVYSVEYYKTARTTAMTVSELNALGSSEWTAYSPFTIRPDDQFTIYLRIEDRSGNVTYVSSDGVILDITAPDVESIAPEITVAPVQQPVNGIYNTDVTVDIKVSDPITNGTYSGLKNVHYQVLNMGNVTQEGDLYNFSYTGGSPLQSQLVQQWTDQIIVDRNLNNSNDVQIVISAQDNSGNYASASNSVKIDVTQPQINITYDNNNGDTSFGEATYFKEDRTATIEITERNFNPDDVQITLTNADGAVPSITGWSSRSGLAANGDETVYTTTLTYSADGDYNFDITYADMAGNQNTATDYGSSLAPQVFTVDKTLPVINVSYDNNAATNGNYYSAARTATISITEHNFETGRFTITTTATDNGVSKTAPGISGWTSNGDIHTATVSFTDDAYYTIGMSYTDMAGNQAAAFTEQNFYVDKTMPYVTLQGIRNNSANNGETIGFILTCTDTNFDVFAPVLTVARLVDGQNKVETYSFDRTVSVANGIQYVIDNLPTDGIYSLVCTVYDKAGNAFNKIIYLDDNGQEVSEMNVTDASVSLLDFSVNRDGSAYKLDDATVAMLGSYYIREIGDNIVIYETNVDDLTEYVVELNGKVLEESKDYTVEKSGGNGEWYVKKYIINKDLFEEEGEYKIVIHTKDSAENEAYSDIKGAELSFVVDKTAPEITVSGVENNGRYQVESQTVTVIPTDDGGKLETLDISVLDNNGNPVEGYPVAYKGSTLTDELDKNNGNITFAIPEGTGMSVVIHCSDVAGNEMKELKYTNIVVSTSGLTIFLANKPLFYGTVGGVVAVVGGGSAVIILRRRKLSAGTKTQDDK
jgi:hypothetical protein